ncbi:hypothetical protein KP509_27G054500 [Ceratopteris richardii]|nr:hypothetical protein KP509_27G054500 [Ceratopteris richardii]
MLFVVLIIIIILGLMAGVLARICGGRHFAGLGEYDFEGWVEHKCASCLDGSMPPALPAALPPPPSQEGPKLLEQSKPDQEKKGDSAEEKQETVPT